MKPNGNLGYFCPRCWLWSQNFEICASCNQGGEPVEDVKSPELKKSSKEEKVDHPPHYTKGGIECIDGIKASMSLEAFEGYLKGNVIKYLWRYIYKNGSEDLNKAQWYLTKLIELKTKEV